MILTSCDKARYPSGFVRAVPDGVDAPKPVSVRAGFLLCLVGIVFPGIGLAHNVTPGDAGYIQEIWGVHVIPFIYLGAKHMVTGYDHILFLLGVVFFLYKMKDLSLIHI